MKKEFEIYPKIVFGTFLVTFEIEGGDLAKKSAYKGGCVSDKVKNYLL